MTESESNLYVFDTSAVLTLIEDEPGADRVDELVRGGNVMLPFVVELETYYVSLQEAGAEEAKRPGSSRPDIASPWPIA